MNLNFKPLATTIAIGAVIGGVGGFAVGKKSVLGALIGAIVGGLAAPAIQSMAGPNLLPPPDNYR